MRSRFAFQCIPQIVFFDQLRQAAPGYLAVRPHTREVHTHHVSDIERLECGALLVQVHACQTCRPLCWFRGCCINSRPMPVVSGGPARNKPPGKIIASTRQPYRERGRWKSMLATGHSRRYVRGNWNAEGVPPRTILSHSRSLLDQTDDHFFSVQRGPIAPQSPNSWSDSSLSSSKVQSTASIRIIRHCRKALRVTAVVRMTGSVASLMPLRRWLIW